MKYAIVSDLHANAGAFRRVLADAVAQGAEKVVCLGDIVGYGPLPNETLALAREKCAIVISGNHDAAVSGRRSAADFEDLAADAVVRHRAALSRADLDWLRGLPDSCEFSGARAAHGDFTDPSAYNYLDASVAAASFSVTDEQLLFVGHTHVPGVFVTGSSGRVHELPPQDFTLEDGKRYIVNPGSVGYPREENGVCRSAYALYDDRRRTVVFRFLPFSVASVLARGRGRRNRLPIFIAAVLTAVLTAVGLFALANRGPSSVGERSLALAPGTRAVRPNLVLVPGSAPASLVVRFEAEGRVVSENAISVKTGCRRTLKVPDGAARVQFAVFAAGRASPQIKSFDPVSSD